jgi:hypothetical protein
VSNVEGGEPPSLRVTVSPEPRESPGTVPRAHARREARVEGARRRAHAAAQGMLLATGEAMRSVLVTTLATALALAARAAPAAPEPVEAAPAAPANEPEPFTPAPPPPPTERHDEPRSRRARAPSGKSFLVDGGLAVVLTPVDGVMDAGIGSSFGLGFEWPLVRAGSTVTTLFTRVGFVYAGQWNDGTRGPLSGGWRLLNVSADAGPRIGGRWYGVHAGLGTGYWNLAPHRQASTAGALLTVVGEMSLHPFGRPASPRIRTDTSKAQALFLGIVPLRMSYALAGVPRWILSSSLEVALGI